MVIWSKQRIHCLFEHFQTLSHFLSLWCPPFYNNRRFELPQIALTHELLSEGTWNPNQFNSDDLTEEY